MPQMYNLNEYAFPDKKIEARKTRFKEIGRDVATLFTKTAATAHACNEKITFREALVEDLANDYFQRVRLFKWRNNFTPEERINSPKMAALMVESAKKIDGRQRLFLIPEKLKEKPIEPVVFLYYACALVFSTLYIRVKEIPATHERDLLICLDQHNIPTEWLCWSLYNFAQAYGEIRDGISE